VNRWIACVGFLLVSASFAPGGANADTRTASLDWTAPGDDAFIGRATQYRIRFSRTPITPGNFIFATPLNTAILPGPSGSREHLTVVGLAQGVSYYFAMQASDERGNWSPVSNIAYLASDVAGIDGVNGEMAFSAPMPNPARGGTRFAVTLPRPQYLRVEAFDIAGRKVRTVAIGQYSAGSFDLQWDLHDDSGHGLEAGAYIVRGQMGDTVFLRRLTVVH
jgi:hypothetical protein